MPFTPQSSEYDAPDDYPLDDESMVFLMAEAGYTYLPATDANAPTLFNLDMRPIRVPEDEQGRTVLNAFKIFLWLTKHPFPK